MLNNLRLEGGEGASFLQSAPEDRLNACLSLRQNLVCTAQTPWSHMPSPAWPDLMQVMMELYEYSLPLKNHFPHEGTLRGGPMPAQEQIWLSDAV